MCAGFLLVSAGVIFLFVARFRLRADLVEMQNGDRYFVTGL
jgi:hypothetical protein